MLKISHHTEMTNFFKLLNSTKSISAMNIKEKCTDRDS